MMLRALKRIHDENVIHGDIKLENFVIDKTGKVRLIDFGLSEKLPDKDGFSNAACGSDNYRAPEQIRMAKHNNKVDVWAMGIAFVALVTGEFPFTTESAYAHSLAVLGEKPKLDDVKRRGGEELLDLVSGMLAKNPKDRPSVDRLLEHAFFRVVKETL
jgi:serine/threonine protein kinase